MIADTDLLRGLGLVMLQAEYAEQQVERILELLHGVAPFDAKVRALPIEQRLARATALVQRLASADLFELERSLAAGPALFARRGEVLRERLYPGHEPSDALHAARPKVSQRPVTAPELHDLTRQFAAYREALIRPQVMRLPRAIAEYRERAAPTSLPEAP
jgi:hypothetical protein